MKKNTLKLSFLFFLVFSFLFSCQKFDDLGNASLEFDGDYATALFTANVEIGDIVGEVDSSTTVELDQDGLLHLIYEGEFTQGSSSDVFASLPLFPIIVLDTLYSFPYAAPNGMILELITLKSATITFGCESLFTEDISLELEFPEIIDPVTGESFKYLTDIAASDGTTAAIGAGSIDLTGWNVIPENGELFIRYTALLPDGTRVALDNFFMLFQNFKASYLEGYLGQEPYILPRDTIAIDFFDRWIDGTVEFAEPSINVEVENSFGFPVRSVFNVMEIWNLDGSIVPVESTILNTGVDFNYPALNEVGESKFTSFSLNKDNSNIEDVFSNRPIAVDYDLDALSNPDSDQSITGFATDTSFFSVFVFVDLPMIATTNNFTIRTDVEIGDDLGEDYEFADYITLKILSENNIPVDLGLQMYFEDENGVALDSLFDSPLNSLLPDQAIIKAAGVDANGYSVSTTYNEIEIDVPREKFTAFSQMKGLGLITILDNAPDEVVRFYDEDDVLLKVGVKAGISN